MGLGLLSFNSIHILYYGYERKELKNLWIEHEKFQPADEFRSILSTPSFPIYITLNARRTSTHPMPSDDTDSPS
jgi:hypothetical protein